MVHVYARMLYYRHDAPERAAVAKSCTSSGEEEPEQIK